MAQEPGDDQINIRISNSDKNSLEQLPDDSQDIRHST